MSRVIMLIPTSKNVGLKSISTSLIYSIRKNNIDIGYLNLINQNIYKDKLDFKDIKNTKNLKNKKYLNSISLKDLKNLILNNKKDILFEKIIDIYNKCKKHHKIFLLEGLRPISNNNFEMSINYEISKILNTDIIFLFTPENDNFYKLKKRIKILISSYGGVKNKNIIGIIFNKINSPIYKNNIYSDIALFLNKNKKSKIIKINFNKISSELKIPVIGCIPWNYNINYINTIDIANYIEAKIINKKNIKSRLVKEIIFSNTNFLKIFDNLKNGSLLITSGNRSDIFTSYCLSIMNGNKTPSLLLTNIKKIKFIKNDLFQKVIKKDVPIFITKNDIFNIYISLLNFETKFPYKENIKIYKIINFIFKYINISWVKSTNFYFNKKIILSPYIFKYKLIEMAKKENKKIILPEGYDPRIIKSAYICYKKKIANCILIGSPKKIKKISFEQGINLKNKIEIIDPKKIRMNYIYKLMEIRKNHGMTEKKAIQELKDNVVLATLMLENSEVDGIVSGAVNTTANTIKPALQIIKTLPGISIVSSIFFMLFTNKVLIYGDCAININPNSEQLSEIAIQSYNSALKFNIIPRVAMISYSTGTSGYGVDVDKVREATNFIKKKIPDIIIDGPIQYDAAVIPDIAMIKAPNSPLKGKANVFIFPNLDTGNTTYKAVQRTSNIISIGPILQGIKKPVNDLSRGANIEDIVYTIAITAIQSKT
ncbi:MAG: phosphate acetyltransferase [Candidatus Makana argininalis]